MPKRLKRVMTLSALCGCGLMGTVVMAEDIVKQDDFKVTPFAKVANYTPTITNMTEVLTTMNDRIVKRLNTDPAKTLFVYADGHVTEVEFNKSELGMADLQPYWPNLVGVITGTNITSIGKNGFVQHPTLKYASIPAVTNLDLQVFAYCVSLEKVDIPLVKEIKVNTFAGCESLLEIHGPEVESMTGYIDPDDGTYSLGHQFSYCTKLQKADFPKCKSVLGQSTFVGCYNLMEVYFPVVEELCDWIFYYEGDSLSATRTTNGEGIPKIRAPRNFKLVDLPSNMKVKKRRMPLRAVGIKSNEMVLKNVVFPRLKAAPMGMFLDNRHVIDVDIPSCGSIGKFAFYNSGIRGIYAPSVTNILGAAFSYSKLRWCIFPACTDIEWDRSNPRTFEGCNYLESISFGVLRYAPEHVFESLPELKNINVGLYVLPEACFQRCGKLESVILPSVTNVHDHAFGYCYNLKFVRLDNVVDFPTRVEYDQGCAFVFCTSLEKVELPNAKNLGIQTFEWCTKLKEVVLPSVTNLERWVFREAKNFTCLNLSGNTNNVTMHSQVFEHGTSSTPNQTVNVVVPDGVYSRWKTQTLPSSGKLYSESGYEVVRVQDINSVINSITPSYGTKSIMGGDTIDLIPGSPMVYSYNGDTAANVSVMVDSNKGRMGTGMSTEFIVNNLGTGTITLTYTRNNPESAFEAWRLATSGTTITSIGPGTHKFRFSILPATIAFWIRDTGAGSGTADATQAPYVLIEKVATYSFSSGTITP